MSVAITVSVSRDLAIADASAQLRAAVVAAVAREVGLDVVRVDIAVEDVHDA